MSGTDPNAGRAGARHLREIALSPRGVGSPGERRAREYATRVLHTAGFDVEEVPFEYSQFPGKFGTPIVGAVLGVSVCVASSLALTHAGGAVSGLILLAGLIVAGVATQVMLGDGVLTIPLLRAIGINLVATRGTPEPRVWLVAHLDSKSQPIPSALRVAGIVALSLGVVLAAAAQVMTLAGSSPRMVWWAAVLLTLAGSLPVLFSVVRDDSQGAVDNASGVAAVLAAAERLNPKLAIGVLLPSAEELGLAGARAWVRGRSSGVALNCDGVDDDGALLMMYSGAVAPEIVSAVRRVAPDAQLRRMPLGLLTDSVAFADRSWRTITVSQGSLRTLRRVHTRFDSLEHMQGTSIDRVADVLARAAEELAT